VATVSKVLDVISQVVEYKVSIEQGILTIFEQGQYNENRIREIERGNRKGRLTVFYIIKDRDEELFQDQWDGLIRHKLRRKIKISDM
jgi:hypothetical protein